MDRNEKDMARSGLDKLLTRIEYKTPVNSVSKRSESCWRTGARLSAAMKLRHKLVQWCVAASVVVMLVARQPGISGARAHERRPGAGTIRCPMVRGWWSCAFRVVVQQFHLDTPAQGSRSKSRLYSPSCMAGDSVSGTPAGRITVLDAVPVKQHRQDMQVFCHEGFALVETPVRKASRRRTESRMRPRLPSR